LANGVRKGSAALTTYFVLTRRISPYSGADVLLGVFDSEHAAQDARNAYLDRYRVTDDDLRQQGWIARILQRFGLWRDTNIKGDPWHEQAYKAVGLFDEDLIIKPLSAEGEPTFNEISVTSCYFDSLGQINRVIDSIHPNRLLAERRMKELQKEAVSEESPAEMPPNGFDTQTVRINELQSDKREDQPRPCYGWDDEEDAA
jgi:hypothetical protein